MRLIDPGPGELFDRRSILLLKIAASEQAHTPGAHFIAELLAITDRLTACLPDSVSLAQHNEWLADLSRVNATIWRAIDELRAAEARHDTEAMAHYGLQALHSNDARATLIARINTACGVAHGPEKL